MLQEISKQQKAFLPLLSPTGHVSNQQVNILKAIQKALHSRQRISNLSEYLNYSIFIVDEKDFYWWHFLKWHIALFNTSWH